MSGAHSLEQTQRRRLFLVLALTGSFCVAEAIAAFVAQSSVLKADALHLTMDVSALAMSLTAMRISSRRPSERFTFGLHRAEPLAAVINAMLVMLGTVLIVKEGLENLGVAHMPLVGLMAKVSTVALIVNGISAYLLHGAIEHGHAHHGHAHGPRKGEARGHHHQPVPVPVHEHVHEHVDGHGHDHSGHEHHHHDHGHHGHASTSEAGDHSMNLRGAWLHVLGDALGSLAALATAGALSLGAPPVVDLLGSFVVAIVLFLGAGRLLRDAAQVLLEGTPAHLATGVVREIVMAVDGVESVLDVHVWTLGAGKDAAAIRVRGGGDVGARVEERLRGDLRLTYVWVHVEAATDG